MNNLKLISRTQVKIPTIVLLFAFFSLVLGTSASAQQLVQNGGFETGDYTGWTLSGESADAFISEPPFVHSGNYAAQLGPPDSFAYISQNLATTNGKPYVLSIWLSNPSGETPNEFQISWNGTVIYDQVNLGVVNWTNLLFTNTATSSSTTLKIGAFDSADYIYFDDVSVLPPGSPPANDNFASPIAITVSPYTTNATNIYATRQTGEPDHGSPFYINGNLGDPGGEGDHSLWWSYTAPSDGYVYLTIPTASFTPLVAIYQGSSVSSLTSVARNSALYPRDSDGDVADFLADNVQFNVLANSSYYIAVDGYGQGSGTFTLTSQFTAAPSNNYYASRIALASNFTTVTGSNLGANLELHEPAHTGSSPGASVWWSWTPTQTGTVTLTTSGSSFDTTLDVYSNTVLTSLSLVAGNDNEYQFTNAFGPQFDPASRVTFAAHAGTNYQIAVCGANGASGSIVLNNLSVAISQIVTNEGTIESDGTLAFTNILDIANLRTNTTGPLRVSLWAQPGYSYLLYLGIDNLFLAALNVPEAQLAVTNLPSSGTLGPTNSTQFTVSGIIPAPVYYTNGSSYGVAEVFGIGYSVLAVLEQQTNGVWQACDSRLIAIGNWPTIGGFQGQGGGVITLAANVTGPVSNPTILEVNLGPPAAIRMGGAWRVSPTNYGSLGELRYHTNYMTNSLVLAVESTNFTIEMTNLPGFNSTSSSQLSITPGSTVPLNLYYSVFPPQLVFSRTKGLGITGTVGTAYRIDALTNFSSLTNFSPLTSNTLAAGTNWVTNTLQSSTNHLFRAFWLSN
jgi:hypothetical protein